MCFEDYSLYFYFSYYGGLTDIEAAIEVLLKRRTEFLTNRRWDSF